jgi:hypothetical protein
MLPVYGCKYRCVSVRFLVVLKCVIVYGYIYCRIGTEHEKFGFEFDTLRPINYKQISALLNGIALRFDWDKIMEGDNIIGLKTVRQFILKL